MDIDVKLHNPGMTSPKRSKGTDLFPVFQANSLPQSVTHHLTGYISDKAVLPEELQILRGAMDDVLQSFEDKSGGKNSKQRLPDPQAGDASWHKPFWINMACADVRQPAFQ